MGGWELENLDRRSRHPNEGRSKFESWVLSLGGTVAVSQAVSVHQITVCAWIARRARPNIATTAKLLKLAGKDLTIEDIVEGTRQQN